jgi:ATP-binding cassette subfamily B multidrug efflux pump
MGDIVDWLSAANRETFLQTEGWKLATLAGLVMIAMPVLDWFRTLLSQQTLMGNYPMRIRWQVHRYLLKQSMTFYQDEFAGRVATK